MEKGKMFKQMINKGWCKGCGICIHFCPKKVLSFDKDEKATPTSPEACIGCRLCEIRCPDLAIQIITEA
ncbi:4Fe-4S binding protein [Desulfocicer niacini]